VNGKTRGLVDDKKAGPLKEYVKRAAVPPAPRAACFTHAAFFPGPASVPHAFGKISDPDHRPFRDTVPASGSLSVYKDAFHAEEPVQGRKGKIGQGLAQDAVQTPVRIIAARGQGKRHKGIIAAETIFLYSPAGKAGPHPYK
jgi:hypothetical protein